MEHRDLVLALPVARWRERNCRARGKVGWQNISNDEFVLIRLAKVADANVELAFPVVAIERAGATGRIGLFDLQIAEFEPRALLQGSWQRRTGFSLVVSRVGVEVVPSREGNDLRLVRGGARQVVGEVLRNLHPHAE